MKYIYFHHIDFKLIRDALEAGFAPVCPDLFPYILKKYNFTYGKFFIYKLEAISKCDYILIKNKKDKNNLVIKSGLRHGIPLIYNLEKIKNKIPLNRRSENRKRSEKHD